MIGPSMKMRLRSGPLLSVPLASVLLASGAHAQLLPPKPITFAEGRVTLGGDVSLAISSDDDDPTWFNYTGYEHNALRMVRLGVAADVRLASRVSLLAQLLTENGDVPRAHALYVRLRPWLDRSVDFQVGRIPPTFGAFSRRSYATTSENPLIGYPLAYQYLTSLRADAVPITADDLLLNRARGWRPSFPLGSTEIATGLPLVTAFEWDTGVQGRMAAGPMEFTAALTTGTLSEPRVRDNNNGKQVSARVIWRPVTGLIAGGSVARGSYLADSVTHALPVNTARPTFAQRAWGIDAEYSRDYWLLRGEAVFSQWRLPAISAPFIRDAVRAWSVSVEGRYAFWPGAFAAARYDHLGFSALQGTAATLEWDAPVARLEIGGGYYFERNLVGKVTYQYNQRDAGIRELGIWSAQVQFWF
jgi:hypothetical protein